MGDARSIRSVASSEDGSKNVLKRGTRASASRVPVYVSAPGENWTTCRLKVDHLGVGGGPQTLGSSVQSEPGRTEGGRGGAVGRCGGVDAPRPINAAVGGVDGLDALQQPRVAERPIRRRPAQPVIEPRG
jgi:hypothetical protein